MKRVLPLLALAVLLSVVVLWPERGTRRPPAGPDERPADGVEEIPASPANADSTADAAIVMDTMRRADAQTAGTVYRDGLSEVLQQPEFAEGEQAQGLVRVMEEHSFLEAVLADALSPEVGSVRVLIGGEGRWNELRACSLVLARYGVTGLITGALGVVGPTRMSYGRAISTVRYVAGLLSDLVYDTYVES